MTELLRMTSPCVYLWILSFSEHFFYRAPRKTAISCTSWRISTTRYIKKLFHRSFQAYYTRTRSSNSKVFTYLKSLKTVCEEVNLLSCKMPTFKFPKKLSHLHSCILHSFSQNTHGYFSGKGFESEPAQFLSESISGK